MLEKIRAYIKENRMLERKDKIVIGVSGGADSVCLFFVLLELCKEYELSLQVMHVNHGIRGAEADMDEAFVRSLAEEKGVNFEAFHADIPAMAKEKGLGEEEMGWLYRYEVLEKVRKSSGADRIAVAHNENDCAETVLLNLFRGSGLSGLAGIAPVRDKIIRPLLCVSRKEIEGWLLARKIPYRTDKTNFSNAYTRNRVRMHFLPLAEQEINEKAIEHTARAATLLREVEAYMEKQIMIACTENVVQENGAYFIKESVLSEEEIIIKGVLKRAMELLAGCKRDLESGHVDSLLRLFSKQTGKEVCLPYGMKGRRQYKGIRLFQEKKKKTQETEEYMLSVPGEYALPNGKRVCLELYAAGGKNVEIQKNDCTKWFDYDKIENRLSLRHRRNGDYLQIRKDGGRKKLKDDLIDRKVPREERDELWLLADGSHVLWVLGGRTSEAFHITEETTAILRVKVYGGKSDGRQD
ncbi:MAG: tRNA lysidine(34) synthetase TilS [Acetivibrio ethanolgignens]